jgi:hypothetical protein
MRYAGLLLAAALSTAAYAHDEGHGPKLTDVAPQGGVITAVVEAKDAKLGPKAPLVYKAELVRSEDGTVRVTFYDKDLKPLDAAKFDKAGSAAMEVVKKKKMTIKKFALALEGGSFIGKMPKPASKPFNIDVTVMEGKRKLLAAFDNLD